MISIDNFHASHIIQSKGGKVSIDNLVPLCSKCNIEMGTKTMEEYCIEIGVDFKDKLSWCKQNSTCQPSVSNSNQSNSSVIDLLVPGINSSNESKNLPCRQCFKHYFLIIRHHNILILMNHFIQEFIITHTIVQICN